MTNSSKKRAWLDLAEQTTQAVDHEADEVHSLMEQPLKRVSFQGQSKTHGNPKLGRVSTLHIGK